MWHVDLEAAPPPVGTSWLESASPAKPSTTLCAQVAFLVMPSPVTSMMLCGIVQIRGTSAALLPVKFNMLVCSSVRTSCPLTAFDVLTSHYDIFVQEYHTLLAALRQHDAIFCHWSRLPGRKERPLTTCFVSDFAPSGFLFLNLLSSTNIIFDPLFLFRLKFVFVPYSLLFCLVSQYDGGFILDYHVNSPPAGSAGNHQYSDLTTRFGGFDFSLFGGTI